MEFNTKLGDILELNPTTPLKKGTEAKKVAMADVKENQKFIESFEVDKFKGGAKFKNGDTLVARITPCLENGKTAFVDILEENEIAFGSTEFFVIRSIENLTDPQYLYYLMRTPNIRNILIKSMTGTSGRQRAQKEALLNTEIDLPPLSVQQAIGRTLKNLDEKIKLNSKIIANLEELAQTLFKRWFVDGKVPWNESKEHGDFRKGISNYWSNEVKLDEIAECQNGYAFYKLGYSDTGYRVVDLANVDISSQFISTKNDKFLDFHKIDKKKQKYLLQKNDLVMIMTDRTQSMNILGKVGRIPESNRYVLNQRVFRIRIRNPLNLNFIHTYLNSEVVRNRLKSVALGSAQKYINTKHITNLNIPLPNHRFIERFNEYTEDIYDTKYEIIKENVYLNELKELLLPKLMSGELELPEELEV